MEPTTPTSGKKMGVWIGIAVVVIVGLVIFFAEKGSSAPVADVPVIPSEPTMPVASTTPADNTKQTASVYKDGTYSATGSYMSPGGLDHISVTLTLANDVVTDVTAVSGAGDHTSQSYQNKFLSGYKQYVVGKNIADIHLTVVSGSSLTPGGFNDALAQIKAQAKS